MTNEEQIVINVKPEAWDLFRPFFWVFFRRLWYMFLLLAFVSLFSLKEFFYENDSSANLLNFLPLFFLLLLFWSIYASARKSAKLIKGNVRYAFSENEVDVTTPDSSSQIKWTFFERAKETKNEFLLFQTKTRFHPIPKRFFQSREQIEELRELLREKLGDKADLK